MSELREEVRDRYAAAALAVKDGMAANDWDVEAGCCEPQDGLGVQLYDVTERRDLPEEAVLASLGCGNPTAVAELHEGEVVLDLGSGGGIDVLLSAKRVGPTGKAYGLDMTDEMLELARENARKAEATNVEFLKGYIEDIPLRDGTVDVVISNCVINLSIDKPKVVDGDVPRVAARAAGSGSATSSPRMSWLLPTGPSAAATSAASPARSRSRSTRRSCRVPASPRSRSSPRTSLPTRCSERSCSAHKGWS